MKTDVLLLNKVLVGGDVARKKTECRVWERKAETRCTASRSRFRRPNANAKIWGRPECHNHCRARATAPQPSAAACSKQQGWNFHIRPTFNTNNQSSQLGEPKPPKHHHTKTPPTAHPPPLNKNGKPSLHPAALSIPSQLTNSPSRRATPKKPNPCSSASAKPKPPTSA